MKYLKYFESNNDDSTTVKHILSEISDCEENNVLYKEHYTFLSRESRSKPLLVTSYEHSQIVNVEFGDYNEDDMINLGTAIKRLKQHYESLKFKMVRNNCEISLSYERVNQTPAKFDFTEIFSLLNNFTMISYHNHINCEDYDDNKLTAFFQEHAQLIQGENLNDEIGMIEGEEPGAFYKYMLKSIDGKHELEIGFDYIHLQPLYIGINNNEIDTFALYNELKKIEGEKGEQMKIL